jgi:F-type H+-transporting ATPase subunit b
MRCWVSGVLGLVIGFAGAGTLRPEERGGPNAPDPVPRVEEDHGAATRPGTPAGGKTSLGAGKTPTAPAHGAGKAAGPSGHGEAEGKARHGGSYWWLFFIQALGFALLIGVLVKYAGPPIRSGIDSRVKHFAEAFRKTEAEDREVHRLVTDYQDKLRGFALEAKRRRDEAARQGRMMKLQVEEEARLQARQMMEKARREGDLMQARARAEVRRIVVDRAFTEAAEVLRRRMDDRFQGALVDRVIAELESLPPPA